MEDYASDMGQRSNYAAETGAQILLEEEEYASGMAGARRRR